MTTGETSAGSYYGYDGMGHTLRRIQQTDSVNYLTDATYNKAGTMLTETYPVVPGAANRRTVSYTFDAAGRLSALASAATTYAPAASVSAISYAPHGALASETLGNNLIHALVYNNRLQPTQIKLGTAALPTSILNLTYNYGTTANNGNVLSTTYAGGGLSYTQTFGYDQLNRLTTSSEGSSWSQTNSYDRYGNRSIVGGALTFNAANNRITTAGYTYDASGNLTNDTLHLYTFDAENKISKVDAVSAYVYNGEGQRVKKLVGENTRFVYGIGGNLVAEFDGTAGNLKKEYIQVGAALITIEPTAVNSNGTRYVTSDHLGSPRVVTNSSAGVVSRHDYMPFGEEIGVAVGGRTTGMGYGIAEGLRQKFTSKERDSETGLDYFGARYYASTQGRFTGIDPKMLGLKQVVNPQRWNRYTYVLNNPLALYDPDGQDNEGQGGDKVIDIFIALTSKELKDAKVSINKKALQKIANEKGYDLRVHNFDESTLENVSDSLKNSDATFVLGHSGNVADNEGKSLGGFIQLKDADLTNHGVDVPTKAGDRTNIKNVSGEPEANGDVVAMIGCDSKDLGLVVDPQRDPTAYVVLDPGEDNVTSITGAVSALNSLVSGYMKKDIIAGVKAGNATLKKADPRDKGDRLVLRGAMSMKKEVKQER